MLKRLIYLCIILIGLLASSGVYWKYQTDLEQARQSYRRDADDQVERTAIQVESTFRLIYQGLRTIARLPAVMQIDRYAKSFDQNGHQTVQEIYNNLVSNLALSEFYIVPKDLEPDQLDPNTGKNQTPIITYDEFIVGRHAGSSSEEQGIKAGTPEETSETEVEEIEIYEYRLMKEQIAWFIKHVPIADEISGIDIPALSGREVITCDNSRYHPSEPNDRDRSGLVYSVPFYGSDGQLKGIISAVFLTHILVELLPSSDFALRQESADYTAVSVEAGTAHQFQAQVKSGLPASELIYSSVRPLKIRDQQSAWILWNGIPNEQFWQRSDVKSARNFASAGLIAVWAVVLGMTVVISSFLRHRRLIELTNQQLEQKISERTAELAQVNQALAQTAQEAHDYAEQADASNRAKGTFLANMSHEIRTPINGIIGMLHGLLNMQLGVREREYLSMMKNSAESLLLIINDILDFSKIDAGKLSIELVPSELTKILSQALNNTAFRAYEKNIEIICEVSPEIEDTIRTDPIRLQQILVNLIGNAIKFTEIGEVTISIEQLALTSHSQRLRFSVADSGIGIAPDRLEQIFQPFTQADSSTTRKYGGTGLGLTICRQLVELLGGSLSVKSTLGQGACFFFELELSRIESITPKPFAASTVWLLNRRVLVVEPVVKLSQSMSHMLGNCGAQIKVTGNLDQSLEILCQAHAIGRPFEIALVSTYLVDGPRFSVLQQIIQDPRFKSLRIIPLVPLHRIQECAKYSDLGLKTIVYKPFLPATLLDALHSELKNVEVSAPELRESIPVTAPVVLQTSRAKKILVADDVKMNRIVAKLMLEQWGHQVTLVENGQQALDQLQQLAYFNPDSSTKPFDLILMDVQMPILDGIETTKLIREKEAANNQFRVPIIALTAHASSEEAERFKKFGLDRTIAKPINPQILFSMIEEQIVGAQNMPLQPITDSAPAVLIDFEQLRQRFDGSQEAVVEVVAATLEDLPQLLERLKNAVQSADLSVTRKAAHALKGVLLNVAANQPAQRVQQIENAVNLVSDNDISVLCLELKTLQDSLVDYLSNN